MDARIAVRPPSRSRVISLGWVVAVLEGLLIASLVPALIFMRGDDKAVERGVSGVTSVQGSLTRADDFATRHLATSAVAPSLGYADDFATRHIAQSVAPSLGLSDDFATRHLSESVSVSAAPSLGYADDFATRHIAQSVAPSLGLSDDYGTRHMGESASPAAPKYTSEVASRHQQK